MILAPEKIGHEATMAFIATTGIQQRAPVP